MLFAYNEDGRLEVVADEAAARAQFEGSDVESGAVRFFDDAGRLLTPSFPDRSERKFLGIRIASDRGPFQLALSRESSERLQESIGPLVVLMPNQWFTNMDAVHAHLSRTKS